MPMQHRTNAIVLTSAINTLIEQGDIQTAEELFFRMNTNTITDDAMMFGKSGTLS